MSNTKTEMLRTLDVLIEDDGACDRIECDECPFYMSEEKRSFGQLPYRTQCYVTATGRIFAQDDGTQLILAKALKEVLINE